MLFEFIRWLFTIANAIGTLRATLIYIGTVLPVYLCVQQTVKIKFTYSCQSGA